MRRLDYAEHGEIIGHSCGEWLIDLSMFRHQRGNRADFGPAEHMGCKARLAHRMSSRGDYAPAFPLIPAEWKDEA